MRCPGRKLLPAIVMALTVTVVSCSPAPGVVSGPGVTLSWPAIGEEQASPGAEVLIVFDRAMNRRTVEQHLLITPDVAVHVRWEDDRRLLVSPVVEWPRGETVNLIIGTGAADAGGSNLGREFVLTFRVAWEVLRVVRLLPGPGAVGVKPDSTVEIEFDRELDSTLGPGAVVIRPEAAGITLVDGAILRFIPERMEPSTDYVVTVGSGLLAADGSTLPAPLVFAFRTVDYSYLWEVDVTGRARVLGLIEDRVTAVAWSPQGDRLAVVCEEPIPGDVAWGGAGSLFIARPDGSSRQLVTDGPLWLEVNSPDQLWSGVDKLTFCYLWHPERESGVWIADFGTEDLRLVVDATGELKPASPAWCPDGVRLAYRMFGDWRSRIMIQDGNGLELADFPITTPEYSYRGLSWSPDGRFLAVDEECDSEPGTSFIWVLDVAGRHAPRRLVEGWRHAWSPDGTSLAYINNGVMVVDLSGGQPRRLVEAEYVGWGPAWSPDGRWIAYELAGDSGYGVVVIHAVDGSGQHEVPLGGRGACAWHPSAARLLIVSTRSDLP